MNFYFMFYIYVMYEWCGFVCVWNVRIWNCTKILRIVYGYATYLKCCGVLNERANVVMDFFLLLKMFFSDFKCLQMLSGIPWYRL